jgi:hypothetical protein
MIPVKPAPEPPDFDRKVRQSGLAAIAELVGEPPPRSRPGPRRKAIASRRQDLPPDAFPTFWTHALEDLLERYQRRCAYLALYLEPATGSPTVDHMVPKSRAWDQVYEWRNYRLCASLINAKKSNQVGLLDPFEIGDGWFALELVAFQVVRGPKAPKARASKIEETIVALGLNQQPCCSLRAGYVTSYEADDIKLHYLERRAPFVASELRRQGRLRTGDR